MLQINIGSICGDRTDLRFVLDLLATFIPAIRSMNTSEEYERLEQYKKITELVKPLQMIIDAKKKLQESAFLTDEEQRMLERINSTLVTVRAELLKLISQIKDDQIMSATQFYYSLKQLANSTNDDSITTIFEQAKKMFREIIIDFLEEHKN